MHYILFYFILLFGKFSTYPSVCLLICGIEGHIKMNKNWEVVLKEHKACKKLKIDYAKKYSESWKNFRKSKNFIISNYQKTKNNINETIRILDSEIPNNPIDSFLFKICHSSYSSFPYKTSGNPKKHRLYYYSTIVKQSKNDNTIIHLKGIKSAEPLFAKIVDLNTNISIPKLIYYLENDAATRLIYKSGVDACDPIYYLSISDVALELIEIISKCSFYDQRDLNHKNYDSNLKFSQLNNNDRNEIKNNILNWYLSSSRNPIEKTEEYLANATYHCTIETCQNLALLGYNEIAIKHLTNLYRTKYPTVGKKEMKKWIDKILTNSNK